MICKLVTSFNSINYSFKSIKSQSQPLTKKRVNEREPLQIKTFTFQTPIFITY